MYERTDGSARAGMRRLYAEFAEFYTAEKCRWAPAEPRRVFNLAFEVVYPDYRDRLSPEQFLGVLYATLGFDGADPPGLFQTFDPTRYNGRRRLDDHFVSLFVTKL